MGPRPDKPLTLQEAKENLRHCEESLGQELAQTVQKGGLKTLLLAAGGGLVLGAFPVSLRKLAAMGLDALQLWSEHSESKV